MLLLLDHYDSFTHNLAHLLEAAGADIEVRRCDRVCPDEIMEMRPAGLVLSPGPGAPGDRGIGMELVRRSDGSTPILGVCLGMQIIASACGAAVVRANEQRHGKTSLIEHCGSGLFVGVPSPCTVMRYHSLIVERSTLPDTLSCDATVAEDPASVMALSWPQRRLYGVQFHPESFLSEHGNTIATNFLRLCAEPRA